MLSAFNCFRSRKTIEPTSMTESTSACARTLFFYKRASVPFVVDMPGGPGGTITLTDEECATILLETDTQMYIGASGAPLTLANIQNSSIYYEILQRHQDELNQEKSKTLKLF